MSDMWYRAYLAVAAKFDALTAERDEVRAELEKMDGDACWRISDLEHDLTDMRLRAEHAEAERDALRTQLTETRKELRQIEADCNADYPPSPGALKYAIRDVLKMIKGGRDE